MFKTNVTTVGKNIGIVLPKEVLAHLKLVKGNSVILTECSGGYLIKPYDPEYDPQMAAAREVVTEQSDVLRALAK